MSEQVIYVTEEGTQIIVSKGIKSPFDFKVRYRQVGKRVRTPRHIHLAVDLLIKKTHNKELTSKLSNYLLSIFLKLMPSNDYPPKLQSFTKDLVGTYSDLMGIGDYGVEFILVACELIMIQEITNRTAELNRVPTIEERRKLLAYKAYNAVNKDIFTVISAATYRGTRAVT